MVKKMVQVLYLTVPNTGRDLFSDNTHEVGTEDHIRNEPKGNLCGVGVRTKHIYQLIRVAKMEVLTPKKTFER